MEIITTTSAIVTFLKANTSLFGMVGIGIALVLILVMYIISTIFNKPIELKLGPINLKFKENKKDFSKSEQIKKLFSVIGFEEKDCSLIDVIVDLTKEKTEEKLIIKLKDTVIRQMTYAEDVMIRIKSLMTNNYSEILQKKLKDGESSKSHRDYRFFQIIVTYILDELKRKTIKQSLQDERILQFNEKEWYDFVEEKTELMINIISEYIDLIYQSNSVVTRDELNEASKKVEEDIKKELKNLYRNLKTIIMEDIKKEQEIDESLIKDINKMEQSFPCPVKQIKKILDEEENETTGTD